MAAGPNAGIYLNKLQSPTQKAKPSQPAYRPGGKGWNKEKVGLRVWGATSILCLFPNPLSGGTW